MNTTQILNNISGYALQIGLLVGIGAALPALLRIRTARARLLYWQSLLAACLALPWLRPWHTEVIAVASPPVAPAQAILLIGTAAPARTELPIVEIALWLLAAGVAARLIWLAIGFLKLARYRRHGQPIPLPPEWAGAAGHATLRVCDEISGPVTFGFFRPVVLLPAGFPAMSGAMRDAILFHELIHVDRSDWLFTLGEELVRAVFWFHPAIWWVLGEIQLSREQTVDQAVIEMTQARDPYVDTLLAMAGWSADGKAPEMDLAPAPLFLRRRHLKQRVMGIVQEVGMSKTRMSKTRMILAQATALAMMAVACWVITGAIPLQAQAQIVADAAGVTVNLNGSQLMHRSPVTYPAEALAKGVEGTVVVQVRLDASGEVTDDAILSGPDELRKTAQQSVLNWHFDRSEALSTRVVNISFTKPVTTPLPGVVPTPEVQFQSTPTRTQAVVTAPAPGGRGGANAAFEQAVQQRQQAQETMMQQRTVGAIEILGLSDSARDQLLAQLPVHVGDHLPSDAMTRVAETARQFDSHLQVSAGSGNTPDQWVIRIKTPDASPLSSPTPALRPAPAGAVTVGGNVQAANLINAVKPVYPPLAKMARQQGTVKFQATIGKDGTMEDLNVLSGPPLLIQAAMEAVKQWVYKPTLAANGAPVEVVTTIDVNFSLSEGPFPPAAQ
jgi:TonB family protein